MDWRSTAGRIFIHDFCYYAHFDNRIAIKKKYAGKIMTFGIFSYTATVLIFTGLAMLVYLAKRFFISPKNSVLSKTDWKVILYTILITTIATGPGEYVALAWRTWTYNPERTFYTRFLGAEVETYLFTILVSLVVSIATLLYANRQDRKRNEAT